MASSRDPLRSSPNRHQMVTDGGRDHRLLWRTNDGKRGSAGRPPRRRGHLPWVDTGTGVDLKVLRIDRTHGTWVIRNRFQPGVQLQTHKHTGTVDGFTLTGRWHYLEYDFVSTAGSYIHEPANSVHTLTVPEDNTRRPTCCSSSKAPLEPDTGRPGRVHDRRRVDTRGVLRVLRATGPRPPERHPFS